MRTVIIKKVFVDKNDLNVRYTPGEPVKVEDGRAADWVAKKIAVYSNTEEAQEIKEQAEIEAPKKKK